MKQNSEEFDVCIVGAGLSGLASAYTLHNSGLRICVLEAGSRTGGRIHAIRDEKTNAPLADLGPSWIWPPYQKHASKWVKEFALELHPQFETGMALLDFDPNQVPRTEPMPGQHGISRITGGPSAIVDAIVTKLPNNCIYLNTQVRSISLAGEGVTIETSDSASPIFFARKVIVAAPLRVVNSAIVFSPSLADELTNTMVAAPTWMAAQAKATILYETPFWRDLGLSGRIASRLGPMVEAHDISGKDGTPAALFGFIGLPANIRANNEDKLKVALVDQLVRCFGPQAEQYTQLKIEDWAQNECICTQHDRDGSGAHPTQLSDIVRTPHWDGRLQFAIAETAIESPGLIDGALEAAERVSKTVLNT